MKSWHSFSVYHNQIDEILSNIAPTLIQELINNNQISKFIFNRSWDRGENLLILLQYHIDTNEEAIEKRIKKELKQYVTNNPCPEKLIEFPVNDWFLPFPNNHIEYRNNFLFDIMETGGLQAAEVAEDLFISSSSILSKMITEAEGNWGIDTSFVSTIQKNIILTKVFHSEITDMKNFFEYLFELMIKSSNLDKDTESLTNLLQEFEETFQTQKEGLCDFISYIIDAIKSGDEFDEDWINQWVHDTNKAAEKLTIIRNNHKYVTPEAFEMNEALNTPVHIQELWPVIAYYLRFVNYQAGILGIYELNLIYTLKRCLTTIVSSEQINLEA